MRTKFYFIRHAEAESNANPLFKGEDVLTEIGMRQAQATALRFKDLSVEKIYTSKILRAGLTAGEIEKTTGIAPTVIECLRERKCTFSVEGGSSHAENFDDFKARLIEAKSFLENVSEKNNVVVSHAIFLKSLIAYMIFGESVTDEMFTSIESILRIDNAAVTKCVFNQEKKKWTIEFVNDQSHLGE